MKTYKLSPEGFKKVMRSALMRQSLFIIFALIGGSYISFANHQISRIVILSIIFSVFITTIVMVAASFNALKNEKKKWLSYELIVSHNSIVCKQDRLPDVEIAREYIVGVEEIEGKGLTIRTNDKHNFIFVPDSLIGYNEVKDIISEWVEIKPLKGQFDTIKPIILSILSVLALTVVLVLENKFIVIPVGVIFTIGMVWSIIEMRKSKHIEDKHKRQAFLVLIPLLVALVRMIQIITM